MFIYAQSSIGNRESWICDLYWSSWRISWECTFRPLYLSTDVRTYYGQQFFGQISIQFIQCYSQVRAWINKFKLFVTQWLQLLACSFYLLISEKLSIDTFAG